MAQMFNVDPLGRILLMLIVSRVAYVQEKGMFAFVKEEKMRQLVSSDSEFFLITKNIITEHT